MEIIKIEVTGNVAKIIEKPSRITAATAGLEVEFTSLCFDILMEQSLLFFHRIRLLLVERR